MPDQSVLAAALADAGAYSHLADRVERLETHISYIFLAGPYAYKIKKAVDLGFLDFTTLRARRFYCEEELRLNRRLAPGVYLGVIPITGTPERPILDGGGEPIEYAVKMRRFDQENLFDALLAAGRITPAQIDRLADTIVAFHASAAVASVNDAYGSPDSITEPALTNFAQIRATLGPSSDTGDLDTVERWTQRQCRELESEFRARKSKGFVRECHGDFHLGNVALVGGDVTIFDCLEFNANLRWIDVINDVAFMVMDLRDRKRPDLAQRFLNRYLETSGDYAGLRLLRFYVVYRAMVRAKVHVLRAAQTGTDTRQRAAALAEYRNYAALAAREIETTPPMLAITHGLSGSGKTTATQTLLETIGAIRLRSDVERKRLAGLAPLARSDSGIDQGLYAADMSACTYRRLSELATAVVEAGYPAIVDATFLRRAQRDSFRELAVALGARFLILDFPADESTLRRRIAARRQHGRDASEADVAVLEHQLRVQEPLRPEERQWVFACDTSPQPGRDPWEAVLRRLGESMR